MSPGDSTRASNTPLTGASMKGAAGSREKWWSFVLSGGASSPPQLELGGCERSHTSPSTSVRRIPFQFSASASSLIYPVSSCGTRMSIGSRERPNQTREVGVLTMRQPRCAPELFLLAATSPPYAGRAASGKRQSPPACAPEPRPPGWFRAAPAAVGRSRRISDSTPPDAPPAPAPSAARWSPAW
jgi:hypothetical protein